MTSRTGEADDRGRVWVFASAVGEVDTAVVASNLGRAMELAGGRSIVLDAAVPDAKVATNEPRRPTTTARQTTRLSARDAPEHALRSRRNSAAQTGFPTHCPSARGRMTRIWRPQRPRQDSSISYGMNMRT